MNPARALGRGVLLCARAWLAVLGGRCPRGAIAEQVFELGVRSLPLVAVCLAFIGAVAVIDAGRQVLPIVGNVSPLGPVVLRLIVREFGPTFSGMVIGTRIGAGIAAELAAMTVSEQVDALRLSAADPVAELVAPRVAASFFSTLALTAAGTLVAALAGALSAHGAFGARASAFLDTSMVTTGDALVALVKAAAFGLAIPTLAAAAGLRASGGAPAVGRATTDGVVGSVVAVIALDLIVGGMAAALG